MTERCDRSVLDHVRSELRSNLCRFLYFGAICGSSEETLKALSDYARENFVPRVSGLLLVYSNTIVHLLESDEEEIFRVCSHLINHEPRILGTCKYFPMHVGVAERFFDKWYGRRVNEDFGLEEMRGETIDFVNFARATNAYREVSKDLFTFYEELRLVAESRACLMERLAQLGDVGDSRLPKEKTLRALLDSSWGESLEKLIENYQCEIRSREIDDDVWPFPERLPEISRTNRATLFN